MRVKFFTYPETQRGPLPITAVLGSLGYGEKFARVGKGFLMKYALWLELLMRMYPTLRLQDGKVLSISNGDIGVWYLLCKLGVLLFILALTQPNSQNAFNHPTSHVLYIFETP